MLVFLIWTPFNEDRFRNAPRMHMAHRPKIRIMVVVHSLPKLPNRSKLVCWTVLVKINFATLCSGQWKPVRSHQSGWFFEHYGSKMMQIVFSPNRRLFISSKCTWRRKGASSLTFVWGAGVAPVLRLLFRVNPEISAVIIPLFWPATHLYFSSNIISASQNR